VQTASLQYFLIISKGCNFVTLDQIPEKAIDGECNLGGKVDYKTSKERKEKRKKK